MLAEQLYQQTLIGYKRLQSQGIFLPLSRYCKEQRVNIRGLRYWMRKNSISIPRQEKGHNENLLYTKEMTDPGLFVPLEIYPPVGGTERTSPKSVPLKDVLITLSGNTLITIKEISIPELSELIVTCNTGQSSCLP